MKKYWLVSLVPVLLVIWWVVGRSQSAPEVHIASVTRGRIESSVPTNGKVEPAQWAAVGAETAGVVQSVSVSRGDQVKAGQPLVTLDLTAARAELAAALAKEKEAQVEAQTLSAGGKPAQLSTVGSSISTAQNAVDVAQRNYDSFLRMQAQNAATKFQVMEAQDMLQRAKLQLAAAQGQKTTLVTTNDISVAKARSQDAQAEVASARHRLELGVIRAPMTGLLYQFDTKVGTYLQPGQPVAMVGNLDQVKVIVYVDEPDLGRVAKENKVVITWDARPGQKWTGVVDKLPTQVVALGTRTVGEVSTVVDNPNHDLLPGVTVNATIISSTADNTVLMTKAGLRYQNGVAGAYRVNRDRVDWTPVKTGISDANSVQLLSGLNPGDKVLDRVIEPIDAEIRNGMRVKAVSE